MTGQITVTLSAPPELDVERLRGKIVDVVVQDLGELPKHIKCEIVDTKRSGLDLILTLERLIAFA